MTKDAIVQILCIYKANKAEVLPSLSKYNSLDVERQ